MDFSVYMAPRGLRGVPNRAKKLKPLGKSQCEYLQSVLVYIFCPWEIIVAWREIRPRKEKKKKRRRKIIQKINYQCFGLKVRAAERVSIITSTARWIINPVRRTSEHNHRCNQYITA